MPVFVDINFHGQFLKNLKYLSIMDKLVMRIRELEMELGAAKSRTSQNSRAFERANRRAKELQFQQDENQKNQNQMNDFVNKLQETLKTYKYQIEEAEEIAALNLAKYRKVQQQLEETEERAKLAGSQLRSSFHWFFCKKIHKQKVNLKISFNISTLW